jgi:catechol 2,3-dioxygenase-like lactoylglutathione lyase family enzyme
MIKVADIAFVRFRAPDLDRAERFLHDFGLVTAHRDDRVLYARGSDPEPWIHQVERGEPGFAGVGFDAACAEDLEAAARLEGASAIEALDGPGGGRRVRFTDPDGFPVEVVHGRAPATPLPAPHALPYNTGHERRRLGVLQRVERGPSRVKRLGHCVLRVSDFARSDAWYRSRFGFVHSDRVHVGAPDHVVTAFMRCDRGEVPVDHHTFLCVGLGEPGFDHAAFEVEDIDAVMLGHEHLRDAGYAHHAGIGRHVLGSQVFDYWQDPWGHVHEHFTDGDLLDASVKPGLFDPATALGTQWGRFGPAS